MIFRQQEPKEFKRWHLIFLVVMIVCAFGLRWYNNRLGKETIKIANRDFTVLVAKNNAQQVKGLSDRDILLNADGMMFLFGTSNYYTMVMRRMRFPIDIVWLNNNKIVDIAPNLAPDKAENEGDLIQYRPRLPSSVVLEFPAGFVAKYGLKVGDEVGIRQ